MTPHQLPPAEVAKSRVLDLLDRSFAAMDGRINPPSSLHRLTEDGIKTQCTSGEVWVLGDPARACIFLSDHAQSLYIGKLAVDPDHQGKGFARRLIKVAETRARAKGLDQLELETRIELTENHAVFQSMGFTITGHGTHDGFSKPTFVIMQKPL